VEAPTSGVETTGATGAGATRAGAAIGFGAGFAIGFGATFFTAGFLAAGFFFAGAFDFATVFDLDFAEAFDFTAAFFFGAAFFTFTGFFFALLLLDLDAVFFFAMDTNPMQNVKRNDSKIGTARLRYLHLSHYPRRVQYPRPHSVQQEK
jgi:hypothetical protein